MYNEETRRPRLPAALGAALAALVLTGAAVVATSGARDHTSAATSTTPPPTTQPAPPIVPSTGTTTPDPAPETPERSPSNEATTTIPAPAPVDEPDPDPDPDSIPDGIVPIDGAAALDQPAAPFEPVVEQFTQFLAPAAVEPAPAPAFEARFLPDDPGPSGGEPTDEPAFAAATGCANRCIDSASVSAVGGSSGLVHLLVELSDPADVEAYLSLAPIVRTESGGHLPPSSQPTATDSVLSIWTTSFDLEPETEYHLLVRAIDEQGTSSVAGSFVTPATIGPDDLALPKPCENGCVDGISVEPGDDGTELAVRLTAHAAATVEYAWSTEQFQHGPDGPYLDDASTRTIEVEAGHVSTLRLLELTPHTAYSVLVRATDSLGGVDTWFARVATPSPPILAGIDRIHVDGDGDDGSRNPGEISFLFGTHDEYWGYRAEAKIASNDTIRPGQSAAGVLIANGHGRYGNVMIFASERDGTSVRKCFVGIPDDDDWQPQETISYCNNARSMRSSVLTASLTLAEIQTFPACAELGVTNTAADHCLRLETLPNSPEQVSFDAVVWFDIDSLG